MSEATLDYDAARDAAINCLYGSAALSAWAAAVLDDPQWDPAEIQAEGARVIGRVARTYDRARRAISDQILDAIELENARQGRAADIIVRLPPEVGGDDPREIHYLTAHYAALKPAQELIEAAAAVAGWEGRYRQKVRRTTIDFLLPAGKADAADYESVLAEPADDLDDARAYWTALLERLAVCGPDDPQQRETEIRREWASVKAAAIGAAGDQVDGDQVEQAGDQADYIPAKEAYDRYGGRLGYTSAGGYNRAMKAHPDVRTQYRGNNRLMIHRGDLRALVADRPLDYDALEAALQSEAETRKAEVDATRTGKTRN